MIVQPSAMQRVAASLAAPKTVERPQAVVTASLAPSPSVQPLRYSEITPEIHAALRILAALEPCYPQHGTRASLTLAGFAGRGRARHLKPNVTDPKRAA